MKVNQETEGEHYLVWLDGEFSASHFLRAYANGEDEPMHGHNWRVQVEIKSSSVDARGISVDFISVRDTLRQELHHLDYKVINDLEPFLKLNPSSENIAKYLYERLEGRVRREGGSLRRVTVWETQSCGASYVKN